MLKNRVIPVLLLKNGGLVKTKNFKHPKYLGDPINTVKLFNDKEVDELIFLDITATVENKEPAYGLLKDIASECFMPLAYGGGVSSLEQIQELLAIGIEKISLNSVLVENPYFVEQATRQFGSSTIIASIDVKRSILGKYEVYIKGGTINTKKDPVVLAQEVQQLGVGEILLNAIDKDGTQKGYDIKLVNAVANAVDIPVIACGGAGCLTDFKDVLEKGQASAVAAGSFFVFHGVHRAVLISYPTQEELKKVLG